MDFGNISFLTMKLTLHLFCKETWLVPSGVPPKHCASQSQHSTIYKPKEPRLASRARYTDRIINAYLAKTSAKGPQHPNSGYDNDVEMV